MNNHTNTTPTAMQQDTDTTRQDATVGVVEAARLLGVSTDAVRARLRRGSLQGHKVEGEWQVHIPAHPVGRQSHPVGRQGAQQSANRMPTFDLTPLADLIERQARDLADARAAAMLWQERARVLGDRLLAIEPGTGAVEGSPANDRGASGVLAWVRRRLGGGDVATK